MNRLTEIPRIEKNRFYNKETKAREVKAVISAIDEVHKVINVLDEKVAPYGYYIPMREIVDSARDWERYTSSSRDVLIAELNGCVDIVNHRIRNHNEPDVTVIMLEGKNKGKVMVFKESTANLFIESDMARLA